MNIITKALIAAGIIDNLTSMAFRPASEYVFEAEVITTKKVKGKALPLADTLTDPLTDAKLVPQALRKAHIGLIGALLRENGQEIPLFDRDVEQASRTFESVDSGNGGANKLMTVEQAIRNNAVVWRVAEHYSRIEGNEWLRSITKRSLVTDKNGNVQVVQTTDEIIRSFDDWLTVEVERNPSDSSWGMACKYAKQIGHAKFPVVGIDEARVEFNAWLNEMPALAAVTRREDIVAAVADRKWKNLINACVSGIRKDIDRVCRDWILLAYSPKLASQIGAIKSSVEYQLLMTERESAELLAQQDELALSGRRMQLDQQKMMIQVGQMKLQAQQAAFQKQIDQMQADMAGVMEGLRAEVKSIDVQESAPRTSGLGTKLPDYRAAMNRR